MHAVHPSSTSTPPCGGAAAAETGKGKGKGKGAGLGDDESGTSVIDGSHTSDAEAFCIAMTAPIVRPPLPPIPAAGVPVRGMRGDGDAERVRGQRHHILQSREQSSSQEEENYMIQRW